MLYRWDRSSVYYTQVVSRTGRMTVLVGASSENPIYVNETRSGNWTFDNSTGSYTLNVSSPRELYGDDSYYFGRDDRVAFTNYRVQSPYTTRTVYGVNPSTGAVRVDYRRDGSNVIIDYTDSGIGAQFNSTASKSTFINNVYSSNQNAYPTNGLSGNYWYIKTPHNYSMKVRCC